MDNAEQVHVTFDMFAHRKQKEGMWLHGTVLPKHSDSRASIPALETTNSKSSMHDGTHQ